MRIMQTYVLIVCSEKEKTKYMEEIKHIYRNNPRYRDRKAFVDSVDLDQMPQNTASDQILHCLPYIQQYFRHISRQ